MTITQKDRAYVAGTYKRYPVEIVRGTGSLLCSSQEGRYIDLTSGIGVTSLGQGNMDWRSAVIAQLNQLQHMSNLYYTAPCADLAEALCTRTGMKKVFFCNSGAEANECAIKLARKYAYDRHGDNHYTIVTLKNSFHGRTLTTLAATGQDHYHELYQPLTPGFCSIEAGDLAALEQLSKSTGIAGVLVEVIQGEGGVLPVDPAFLQSLQDWCNAHDALFMVDEVQTGNGRTGQLYAYMNYDLKPDVVSTAKGLGGGLPLGATLIGEKAQYVLDYGDHGSTFGGNPVCCAGALAILEQLTDSFLADVRRKGDMARSKLTGCPGIEAVTGLGLMIGIKTTRPASDVVKECMYNGVLCLTAKDRVRLLPPLNIQELALSYALSILKAVCAKV